MRQSTALEITAMIFVFSVLGVLVSLCLSGTLVRLDSTASHLEYVPILNDPVRLASVVFLALIGAIVGVLIFRLMDR